MTTFSSKTTKNKITIGKLALAWLNINGYYLGLLKGIDESAPIFQAVKDEYKNQFQRDMEADIIKYLKGQE